MKWNPIGKTGGDYKFIGTFYGQNHFISGIYVSENCAYVGLFGNSNGIEDLTIKNSYIKNLGWITGGISGSVGKKISNCKNINTIVIGGSNSSWSYTGGVIGNISLNGIVENCYNYGTIKVDVSNARVIGGVIGCGSGSSCQINNCINNGNVFALNCERVGGIVGNCNFTSKISNCQNYGKINGKENIGGIIGTLAYSSYKTNSTLEKCYNSGEVIGNNIVGGIVGNLGGSIGNGTVKQCYNKGKVTGTTNVGEILGNSDCTTIVDTITADTPGNLLKDLFWLNGVNNNLPAIGNIDLTDGQKEEYNINLTDENYTYEQFLDLWE